MQLHCAKGTISVAVAIALEEAGVSWTDMRVDFATQQQASPAFQALNPKGRVPVLVDGAQVLTETGALLEYVAPGLVPSDPYAAVRMREVMYYLSGTMHVAHAHKMRGHRWADAESSLADMRAKVPQTMTACCAYLESTLTFGPFATGDAITCADPYLYVVTGWAPDDGVQMAAFPKVARYRAMMGERASVQAVQARGLL